MQTLGVIAIFFGVIIVAVSLPVAVMCSNYIYFEGNKLGKQPNVKKMRLARYCQVTIIACWIIGIAILIILHLIGGGTILQIVLGVCAFAGGIIVIGNFFAFMNS